MTRGHRILLNVCHGNESKHNTRSELLQANGGYQSWCTSRRVCLAVYRIPTMNHKSSEW